jgi:hypothetical protein
MHVFCLDTVDLTSKRIQVTSSTWEWTMACRGEDSFERLQSSRSRKTLSLVDPLLPLPTGPSRCSQVTFPTSYLILPPFPPLSCILPPPLPSSLPTPLYTKAPFYDGACTFRRSLSSPFRCTFTRGFTVHGVGFRAFSMHMHKALLLSTANRYKTVTRPICALQQTDAQHVDGSITTRHHVNQNRSQSFGFGKTCSRTEG